MIKYLKSILVPSSLKVELEAVVTWSVSWQTPERYGRYKEHMQVFTSQNEAKIFSRALKEAHNLLGFGYDLNPKIKLNED